MSLTSLRNSLEWALMVALVLGGGALAQAQNENEGKIVRLGPGGEENITITEEAVEGEITPDGAEQQVPPELPKHWIGIMGTPVTPELRAHLDVPEGYGLLVRHVVPESPAAKAGLENFDILLKANGTDLAEMRDLMELVKSEGEKGGTISLEVLRRGERTTLSITPEDRPEEVAGMGPGIPGQGEAWGAGAPQGEDVLRFFDRRLGDRGPGGPFQFRVFGPGTVLNGRAMNLDQMPNGVSVSIQKQEGGAAKITVQRGDETWHVVSDDPGSLEQLPEDLRPFVEQLLAGGGPMQIPLPAMPNVDPNMPIPPGPPGARGAFNDHELRDRLEAMEKHLEAMQQQLEAQLHESDETHGAETE